MALTMLQRMVWNNQGWRRPAGVVRDAGYADANGFGHEEWNFQVDDQLGGELIGYLYYKPAEKVLRRSANSFDIGFFTIDPERDSRWLVGTWYGARFAEDEEVEAFHAHFEAQGIYERRAVELASAVPAMGLEKARKMVREGLEKGWLRFVVPVSGVRGFEREEWGALPDEVGDKSIGLYFTRPTFVTKLPHEGRPRRPVSGPRRGILTRDDRTVPLAEDGYLREVGGGLAFITREHAALSNRLARWLRANKYTAIRQEESRVDVEFREGDLTCRAEIKVCGSLSTRHAIREALGQLLEYNHYGWRSPADRWWIVLDRAPTQDDRDYITRLRERYHFTLRLGWCDGEGFTFDRA